jgi:predicted porin
MKKSLLALAVASAIPGLAVAQNVSVYGIVDTAFQSYDNGTATYLRSFDHGLATSRFGFTGSEDLGGGLKAEFRLEGRVNPSAGSIGSTLFNRAATVGVSGGFGQIVIGQWSTTDTQGIDSKVSQAGNFALRSSAANAGGGTALSSGEMGSDVANVVRYNSPVMNGFQIQVGFASGNAAAADGTAVSITDAQADVTDVYVQYEQGPLGIYAGRAKKSNPVPATATDFQGIGAKYDFGFAAVGVTLSSADANFTTGKVDTMVASAKVPLGAGLNAHAVYAQAEVAGTAQSEGSGYTLALTKALSKRTTVYGAYTTADSGANGKFAMTGVTLNTTSAAGVDQKAITLGINHSF